MKYYEVFKGGVPAELYILPEKERLKYEFTIKNGLIAYTIPYHADTYKEPLMSKVILYGIITIFVLIALWIIAIILEL